jgi:hypothetical protein
MIIVFDHLSDTFKPRIVDQLFAIAYGPDALAIGLIKMKGI